MQVKLNIFLQYIASILYYAENQGNKRTKKLNSR